MNDHIHHLEDLAYMSSHGFNDAKNILNTIATRILSGNRHDVSLKYDGIAVFVGVDPADGKFFVSNKAFLNKTPKLYKSLDEIAQSSMKDDLKMRLTRLFNELSHVDFFGLIYQGDLMYVTPDLKINNIFDRSLLTFQANTIVYGIPMDTRPWNEIVYDVLHGQIGVVWHTRYRGKSITELTSEHGFPMPNMSESIYEINPNYSISISQRGRGNEDKILSLLESLNRLEIVDIPYIDLLSESEVKSMLKYHNSFIRSGVQIDDYEKYYCNYIDYGMDGNKYRPVHSRTLIEGYLLLRELKDLLLKSFAPDGITFGTFLKTNDGYIATEHEGYVVGYGQRQLTKLVNRREFSHANFSGNFIKAW